MLGYAVLCLATLCYAVLCFAVLCFASLCYASLGWAPLGFASLRWATLCCGLVAHAPRAGGAVTDYSGGVGDGQEGADEPASQRGRAGLIVKSFLHFAGSPVLGGRPDAPVGQSR